MLHVSGMHSLASTMPLGPGFFSASDVALNLKEQDFAAEFGQSGPVFR